MLMILVTHPRFYICFIDVRLLPADEKDRPKHVRVLKGCL